MKPTGTCDKCGAETRGYMNGLPVDPLQYRHADTTLADDGCARTPKAPKCFCDRTLMLAMRKTPHRDAGVQPMLECPDHGAWINAEMNYHRMKEAFGVVEALEAERDELRKGIILVRKMLDNPHVYRTEPGLLSDLLLRALESKL